MKMRPFFFRRRFRVGGFDFERADARLGEVRRI
jgi:hypothetical protein